jgi:hypothetical protein
VHSDLVIADLDEAPAVAASDSPVAEWAGFTFNGLDSVKLCTLLSVLRSADPLVGFERYLALVQDVGSPGAKGPSVCAVAPDQVAELAGVAAMEEDEFDRVAAAWGKTEEFEGWSESETTELLRAVGDLAESASLDRKCLLLWQSL